MKISPAKLLSSVANSLTWAVNSIGIAERDRFMYYRVLAAQTKGGLTPEVAVFNAGTVLEDQPIAVKAAKILQSGFGNDGVYMEWRRKGLIPQLDAYLLTHGDRTGQLGQVLKSLIERNEANLTFFRQVVSPNLYFICGLIALCLMAGPYAGLLEQVAGEYPEILQGQIGYLLAVNIVDYRAPAALGILAFSAIFSFTGKALTGSPRKRMRAFFKGSDMINALRYVELSELLSRQGVSYTDNVRVARRILSTPHMRSSLGRVLREIAGGKPYEREIAREVLPENCAQLLAALVPGGDRSMLPTAYGVLREVLTALLTVRFSRIKTLLQMFVILLNVSVIGAFVISMYGTINAFTAAVSLGG